MTPIISRRDRVLGGLWGSVVGDALGVPVEFTTREQRRADPVTALRSGGTWKQPAGTWSDDTSLSLCTIESLLTGFDTGDMGRRFVEWMRAERWTPWGKVFDIGGTTHDALNRIAGGVRAEEAGGTGERSNGNGSLMRMLPIALASTDQPIEVMIERAHRASSITHRHPRSQMACGFLCLVAANLLQELAPDVAYHRAIDQFKSAYRDRAWSTEHPHFEPLLNGRLAQCTESEISSGGYVLDTLTAGLWCLLTNGTFEDTVLTAVNLGRDADTTACVAGGLAGLCRGIQTVPQAWIKAMARRGDLDLLFTEFAELTVDH